jgi:predicted O-methyltransferase YrrM
MRASRIRQRMRGLPRSIAEVNRSLQHLASLRALGWHQSLRRQVSIDAEGRFLPWYTYPCIEWLAGRLQATDVVFEFGAGSSTLWYGQRVARVIAVEHDPAWFSRLADVAPTNVELELRQAASDEVWKLEPESAVSAYVGVIERFPARFFDVVVVDGMERLTCVRSALPHLKDDGLLILDNSDRPAYRPAVEYLADQGMGRIDFFGFTPGLGVPSCTSVFAQAFGRWVTVGSTIRTWGV